MHFARPSISFCTTGEGQAGLQRAAPTPDGPYLLYLIFFAGLYWEGAYGSFDGGQLVVIVQCSAAAQHAWHWLS